MAKLTIFSYPDLHHSQGGMKFATQISPLLNYFKVSKKYNKEILMLASIFIKCQPTLVKSWLNNFLNASANLQFFIKGLLKEGWKSCRNISMNVVCAGTLG